MNPDDPKFTAYVLDELSTDEHEQVLREIESNEELAAEAHELRHFAESLRAELKGETSEPLTPEQRAAVLGESLPAASTIVVPRVPWWRHQWIPAAAAAVLVCGLATTIYFQAKHIEKLTAQTPVAFESRPGGVPVSLSGAEQTGEKDLDDSIPAPPAATETEMFASRPAESTQLTPWLDSQSGLLALNNQLPEFLPPSLNPPSEGRESAGELPAIEPLPEEPAKPSTPLVEDAESKAVATGKIPSPKPSKGRAGGTMAARNRGGYAAPEYDSASVETLNPPANDPEPRDRSKRLTQAERKVQKELKDLKARLESLEKIQRKEATKKIEDPLLKQTVEHVRRTLEALQAAQDGQSNTETYDSIVDNPFLTVRDNQLSTFSVDVDTGSYTNVRRFLESNQRPPFGAVRIEELLNYFRYDYPQPAGNDPFSCLTEVATCPWAPDHRLVRIGIKGREIARNQRPPANLVFLIDVSGSMEPENKLPLVKSSLRILTDQLGPEDTVSIAVYAGASGCVLEPTRDMNRVRAALDRLEAGGTTNGASGIHLAYDLAQRSFKRGASNRVILCTDGDFNVGISDQSQLVSLIRDKAKTGIFLSVLGFGFGNLKDSTLEKLADKGNGFYGYVDSLAEGRRLFVEQLTGSLITIAKDVKLQVEFNPSRVVAYRLIGYENRLLAKEDFNNDEKDAGEIGSGHTVTALYEIVPVGKEAPAAPDVDELKYGPHLVNEPEANPELLTVKVRYKQPDAKASSKLEFPLTDAGATWEKSTRDFRWAAAVAGFGMLLRESPHKGSLSWALVDELAMEGKTDKAASLERAQFVGLIQKARALSR
jgi:secreted protein with Ig-like and vWFA domain